MDETKERIGDLRLVLFRDDGCHHRRCTLCGAPYETEYVSAGLVEKNEEVDSSNPCRVCPQCLAAGPRGAAERMTETIAVLQSYVEDLKRYAPVVAEMPADTWLTSDQLYRENQRIDEEIWLTIDPAEDE